MNSTNATGSRASAVRRTVMPLALAALLAASSGLVGAPRASAALGDLQWGDGDFFATFGPNAAVTIDIGFIDFLCDTFFRTADVYVLDAVPEAGATLVDVGVHNTVFGTSDGLFSDTIAFTAPGGQLGAGTYTVVYDECQDGKFDAGVDDVFVDVFEVVLPAVLPPIDPTIGAIKAEAGDQAEQWRKTIAGYDTLLYLEKLEVIIKCVTFNVEACVDAFAIDTLMNGSNGLELPGIGSINGMSALSPMDRIKVEAKDAMTDMFKHWDAIEADPPDPAFQQVTRLTAVPTYVPEGDALDRAFIALAQAAALEAALEEALLHAIERYQGADIAGNARWAEEHARAGARFATLLAEQVARTGAALADLRAAVAADPRDLDAVAAFANAERTRLATDGLNDAEVARAAALGVTPAQLNDALLVIDAVDLSGFTKAGFDQLLADQLAADATTIAALDDLALGLAGLAAAAAGEVSAGGHRPVADAGGPYAVTAGTPMALDGTASADDTATIASYAWDLDGDAVFDDAAGATPTTTLQPGYSIVGLRVIDVLGEESVAYALTAATSDNAVPTIDAAIPADPVPAATVGSSVDFSVAASDQDGHALAVAWEVDGLPAGDGAAMTLALDAADIGVRLVEAIVSDGQPGGMVRRTWHVLVTMPDGDGDGWPSNVDCNDASAAINPGVAEVPGNGLDDDCSIYTVDGGVTGSSITMPIVIRDFSHTHPDFEDFVGTDRGIVQGQLGADGKPVYASSTTTRTTTGAANFNQWYNDVPGVNVRFDQVLTFNQIPGSNPPVYRVEQPNFFPINGLGWGNECCGANFWFTVEGHSRFTYRGGEFFSFTGDDDVWVFINGRLVIDLGGVHPPHSAGVSLDAVAAAIGIVPGGTYDFDFFSAERHTVGSTLIADTSIELLGAVDPLSVAADVTPTFERHHAWTLEHTASPDAWDLLDGDTATSTLTVAAERTVANEELSLAGEVCVTNTTATATSNLAIEAQAFSTLPPSAIPAAIAPLDVTSNPVLDPAETGCYPVSTTLDADDVGIGAPFDLVVAVTTDDPDAFGASVTAVSLPGAPALVGDAISVDVTDHTPLAFDTSGSQSWPRSFTCPADAGGYDSVATITGTDISASASVNLACRELELVLRTATLERTTHSWAVDKRADRADLTLAANESFPVTYDVAVSASTTTHSDLAGSLAIHNPAPYPVTVTAIADATPGAASTFGCGMPLPMSVGPGETRSCTYEAATSLVDGATIEVALTVQQQAHVAGTSTPTGSSQRTVSSAVDVGAGATVEIDQCVEVDDSLAGLLGTVCATDGPRTFTYVLELGPFGNSTTVDNTATATAASGATARDTWSLAISRPERGCTLTIGYWKTHAGFGPQRDMVSPLLPVWLGTAGGSKSVQVVTTSTAVTILGMSGDASNGLNRLQAQLLAAKLNVASGADPSAVAATLASADEILAANASSNWKKLSKNVQRDIAAWAATVDLFNRGLVGPGHCTQ